MEEEDFEEGAVVVERGHVLTAVYVIIEGTATVTWHGAGGAQFVDIDGDGDLDLAMDVDGDGRLDVLRNEDGRGTFAKITTDVKLPFGGSTGSSMGQQDSHEDSSANATTTASADASRSGVGDTARVRHLGPGAHFGSEALTARPHVCTETLTATSPLQLLCLSIPSVHYHIGTLESVLEKAGPKAAAEEARKPLLLSETSMVQLDSTLSARRDKEMGGASGGHLHSSCNGVASADSPAPAGGTTGQRKSAREWLRAVVTSSAFGAATNLLVGANLILMTMPYDGMSPERRQVLETITSQITNAFIVEFGLKLIALGCAHYWRDQWNCVDGMIVICAIGEKLVGALLTQPIGVQLSFLRFLRLLRVLRMLRMLRTFRGLHELFVSLAKAMRQMHHLLLLFALFLLIAALVGMQLFGGRFTPHTGFSREPCPRGICPDPTLEPVPRLHFDYL